MILVSLLGSKETELLVGSTASAKCVVKSLGVLVGFLNSADWDSVELPLETLIKWSLDKRPKVIISNISYNDMIWWFVSSYIINYGVTVTSQTLSL